MGCVARSPQACGALGVIINLLGEGVSGEPTPSGALAYRCRTAAGVVLGGQTKAAAVQRLTPSASSLQGAALQQQAKAWLRGSLVATDGGGNSRSTCSSAAAQASAQAQAATARSGAAGGRRHGVRVRLQDVAPPYSPDSRQQAAQVTPPGGTRGLEQLAQSCRRRLHGCPRSS